MCVEYWANNLISKINFIFNNNLILRHISQKKNQLQLKEKKRKERKEIQFIHIYYILFIFNSFYSNLFVDVFLCIPL